jgi:50S ribosomal subunit-associated GTPase HflX
VKGKLLALGVIYARTEYKVIESFNYTMPKSKFTGPGEIEELNRLAAKDKVKLVVIPSKYTPEQLDEAKKLCGEPVGSSVPEPRPENHP